MMPKYMPGEKFQSLVPVRNPLTSPSGLSGESDGRNINASHGASIFKRMADDFPSFEK
jgi:hypothetical protein